MSGIERWGGLSALCLHRPRTWGDAPGWYGIGALPLVFHTTSFLAPLAEQRRIVAKVHELMALVDALETELAASIEGKWIEAPRKDGLDSPIAD